MTNRPDDKIILAEFNRGGAHAEKAFNSIVHSYGRILFSQIFRIVKNQEQTKDVLQDTLTKVYQNLKNFKGESALYSWMYRIARNEALNFIEKENRRTGVDLDATIIEIKSGHAGLDNLSPEIISQSLEKAIDALPEKQAEVFRLKYFEDLKFSEIARLTGISEGGLKANFHHAKKKIQENLKRQLNLL